jgi:hypothetical protein
MRIAEFRAALAEPVAATCLSDPIGPLSALRPGFAGLSPLTSHPSPSPLPSTQLGSPGMEEEVDLVRLVLLIVHAVLGALL